MRFCSAGEVNSSIHIKKKEKKKSCNCRSTKSILRNLPENTTVWCEARRLEDVFHTPWFQSVTILWSLYLADVLLLIIIWYIKFYILSAAALGFNFLPPLVSQESNMNWLLFGLARYGQGNCWKQLLGFLRYERGIEKNLLMQKHLPGMRAREMSLAIPLEWSWLTTSHCPKGRICSPHWFIQK